MQSVAGAGADRFFIADPDGNNIELIQWFRRWDDWSEEELGVPDNQDRSMLIDEWQEERRRQELPST
jgi:hypothetical protein